jgi:hypothetical protein
MLSNQGTMELFYTVASFWSLVRFDTAGFPSHLEYFDIPPSVALRHGLTRAQYRYHTKQLTNPTPSTSIFPRKQRYATA